MIIRNFKNTIIGLTLILIFFINVYSQTPMYYNYAINEHTNYFPFGVVGGERVQWLYPAGNFNQPTLSPSGNITKVYFFMGFYNGNSTLSQLTVRLSQSDINTFATGSFYSGQLDTVFFANTINLSSVNGQWMSITLDRPFYYDSSKSLIVDITQCSSSSGTIYVTQHQYTPFKRNYSFYSPCPPQYYGQDGYACNFGFDLTLVGIINNQNQIPKSYSLEQNYPNPFNPTTIIKYQLPISSNIKLVIYDILGNEIKVLVNEKQNTGSYNVEWDASNFAGGVYFYRLNSGDFTDVKKMVLIK